MLTLAKDRDVGHFSGVFCDLLNELSQNIKLSALNKKIP